MNRRAKASNSGRLSRPLLRSISSSCNPASLLNPPTVGGVVTTTLALSICLRSSLARRRFTAALL